MLAPIELLHRYRQRGVLIDTNLLTLFAVGVWDRDQIPSFKRTNKYIPEDFDLLASAIQRFSHRFTTPHILAEVSNLLFQLAQPGRDVALGALRDFTLTSVERMPHAKAIVKEEMFSRFGVADTGIRLSARSILILTDDLPMASHLSSVGVAVVNFNHIRLLGW